MRESQTRDVKRIWREGLDPAVPWPVVTLRFDEIPGLLWNRRVPRWRLVKPWRVRVPEDWRVEHDGEPYLSMTVPAGFECDLASIPRIAYPFAAPHELSLSAAIAHDAHHAAAITPRLTRRQADRLFLRLMRHRRVVAWRRWPAFAAVRLFGGLAYRR